jgi:hypothetical protein
MVHGTVDAGQKKTAIVFRTNQNGNLGKRERNYELRNEKRITRID